MAYLYQKINDVPGLSGSSYQKQKQLYERMGSPMGAYRGTAQQNIWLLNQINNGSAQRAMNPQPAPQPQPAASPQQQSDLARQIADQAGADSVYQGPVFSEVLPFYEAWDRLLPMVEEEAASEVTPALQRQLRQASEQIYNQMAQTGGGRFGGAWGQIGDAQAAAEQQRKAQILDWTNQRRQGFKELWYDPSERSFNQAIELGKTPTSPTAPTWQDYTKTMGGNYTPNTPGQNSGQSLLNSGQNQSNIWNNLLSQ